MLQRIAYRFDHGRIAAIAIERLQALECPQRMDRAGVQVNFIHAFVFDQFDQRGRDVRLASLGQ